jgi:hypothetical protein
MLYLLREEIRIDRSTIPLTVDLVQRIVKSPMAMRQPELIGMTELVLEEARAPANTNLASNDLGVVAPASFDEFSHQASLFHVPAKAKQRLLRLSDYSELV